MVYQRIHKSSSQNPPSKIQSSLFAPNRFTANGKHNFPAPVTQQDIESETFNQNKSEAFGLQLKQESGKITPVEQKILGVLQAKMDDFWVQKRERLSHFGHRLDKISIHSPERGVSATVRPQFTIQKALRANITPQPSPIIQKSLRIIDQGEAKVITNLDLLTTIDKINYIVEKLAGESETKSEFDQNVDSILKQLKKWINVYKTAYVDNTEREGVEQDYGKKKKIQGRIYANYKHLVLGLLQWQKAKQNRGKEKNLATETFDNNGLQPILKNLIDKIIGKIIDLGDQVAKEIIDDLGREGKDARWREYQNYFTRKKTSLAMMNHRQLPADLQIEIIHDLMKYLQKQERHEKTATELKNYQLEEKKGTFLSDGEEKRGYLEDDRYARGKYKSDDLKSDDLKSDDLKSERKNVTLSFPETTTTRNPENPYTLAAAKHNMPTWAGNSFTTLGLMKLADWAGANKNEKTALAWGIFAYWRLKYDKSFSGYHTFHEVMDIAKNFGVDYTAFEYGTLNFEEDQEENTVDNELLEKVTKFKKYTVHNELLEKVAKLKKDNVLRELLERRT